jgi:hypothetical protein
MSPLSIHGSVPRPTAPLVVGLGESLFDLLPGGPVLGGAPINVAVHVRQLFDLVGVVGGRPGSAATSSATASVPS